jgi:hypothetical protein
LKRVCVALIFLNMSVALVSITILELLTDLKEAPIYYLGEGKAVYICVCSLYLMLFSILGDLSPSRDSLSIIKCLLF